MRHNYEQTIYVSKRRPTEIHISDAVRIGRKVLKVILRNKLQTKLFEICKRFMKTPIQHDISQAILFSGCRLFFVLSYKSYFKTLLLLFSLTIQNEPLRPNNTVFQFLI